jgi:hypothetical protein
MSFSTSNETWIYDSTSNNWTKLDTQIAPTWRGNHAMAYDDKDDRILVFGGDRGGYDSPLLSDIWTLDLPDKARSGTYISTPLDTGGAAYFGDLRWSGETPPNTSIGIQLRTADTLDEMKMEPFVGFDGTSNTCYASAEQRINSLHNGSRWVQYRVFFQSTEPPLSPILTNVSVDYNLKHLINLLSPTGGDNWTGIQDILWSASDKDNDTLVFDLFLENEFSNVLLASNLSQSINRFSWNTEMIQNGTYRLRVSARDDNLYIPLTVDAISGNFTIYHSAPVNHLPTITLLSPPDKSYVNSLPVRFSWQGSDPDGDALSYILCVTPVSSQKAMGYTTSNDRLDINNLSDNVAYRWSVTVFDNISSNTSVPSESWTFTVRLPPANIPVRITSTPPLTAWTGQLYMYNITTVDEDGDIPTFNLLQGPPDMTLDSTAGRLRWIPGPSDLGTFPIKVNASDGRGSSDIQIFNIRVLETPAPPAIPPTCKITSPANGSKVSGTIQISGTAAIGRFSITSVFVRIDGSDWKLAIGLDPWSISIDTASLAEGKHRIEARAFDGTLYSETASVDLLVANPEPSVSSGWNPWCLPAILVAFVAGIGVLLFLRRKGIGPN